jgi:hypothetical protein
MFWVFLLKIDQMLKLGMSLINGSIRTMVIIVLLLTGCSTQQNKRAEDIKAGSSNISTIRKNINPKPVASYIVSMGDPKLDRKFGVDIFETAFTFKYYMIMQYDGTIENDTLYLPELETYPEVVVKPGPENLSCIIGFLDDKKIFRPYKMMSTTNHQ